MRKPVHIRSSKVWGFVANWCPFFILPGLPKKPESRFETLHDINFMSVIGKAMNNDVQGFPRSGFYPGLLRDGGCSLKQCINDKNASISISLV